MDLLECGKVTEEGNQLCEKFAQRLEKDTPEAIKAIALQLYEQLVIRDFDPVQRRRDGYDRSTSESTLCG